MFSFIFWLILLSVIAKNNDKVGRFLKKNLGVIIFGIISISVLIQIARISFDVLFGLLALVFMLAFAAFPFWVIFKIISIIFGFDKKKKEKKAAREAEKMARQKAKMPGVSLSKSESKRRKIVVRFSKKYNLNLTEKEIDTIVSASYMSNEWEYEIASMDKRYHSIAEWYAEETAWLRAYLSAFSIQSVTSNFVSQKKICLESFDQIFSSVKMSEFNSIGECIEHINNIYMTNFDDMSFSIAHKFLEDNGRVYPLPNIEVFKGTTYADDIEQLKKKYSDLSNLAERYDKTDDNKKGLLR